MSDPIDPMAIAAEGGKVASGGLGALLLAWLLRKKDTQDSTQDSALVRIEAALVQIRSELRSQGERFDSELRRISDRFTSVDHQLEALKERVNGGLANHSARLEAHAEKLTRLETLQEVRGK